MPYENLTEVVTPGPHPLPGEPAWHDKPTGVGLWVVMTTNPKFQIPTFSFMRVKSDETVVSLAGEKGVRVYGPIPPDSE